MGLNTMNKVMSNKWIIFLYTFPALLLICVLIVVPLILSGYFGLMDWDGISAMEFIGLENYIVALQDTKFWESALHSFLLAIFSALRLILYLTVALILASKIKGTDFLRKIYLIPMLLSSVAIAQLWIKIYNPSNGMLNSILMGIGIDNPPTWLADPSIVLYSIFVPIIWQYAGFYILIYYAALKNIPESLIEAARIDGATPLQIALKVKLPLIMNDFKLTFVYFFFGFLNNFNLFNLMKIGDPTEEVELLESIFF